MSAARTRSVPFAASAAAVLLATLPAAPVQGAWLVRAAVEAGGDELEGVRFTDGSTETIEAGGLAKLELGARFAVIGPAFDTELTVGYKFDTVTAENADLSFTRVTLDAMQFVRIGERFRVGGGVTYHAGPTLDVEGPDGRGGRVNLEAEADDAFGFALAADYLVGNSLEIGLRAARIEYDFEGDATRSGDSVGAYLTLRF